MATASPATFTELTDNIASQVAFHQKFVSGAEDSAMKKLALDLESFVLIADEVSSFNFSNRFLGAVEQVPRMLDSTLPT